MRVFFTLHPHYTRGNITRSPFSRRPGGIHNRSGDRVGSTAGLEAVWNPEPIWRPGGIQSRPPGRVGPTVSVKAEEKKMSPHLAGNRTPIPRSFRPSATQHCSRAVPLITTTKSQFPKIPRMVPVQCTDTKWHLRCIFHFRLCHQSLSWLFSTVPEKSLHSASNNATTSYQSFPLTTHNHPRSSLRAVNSIETLSLKKKNKKEVRVEDLDGKRHVSSSAPPREPQISVHMLLQPCTSPTAPSRLIIGYSWLTCRHTHIKNTPLVSEHGRFH